MKAKWLKPFEGEIAWWRTLTREEKLYVAYFYFSFIMVIGLADDNNPILVVLNFGNSVRLIKRVPIDKLEE